MNIKTIISTIIILLILNNKSLGQEIKYNPIDFKEKPLWINMMEDSTANYYIAIQAYNEYWKDRLKPMEEEDMISEIMSKKEEKEREKNERKIAKLKPEQRNEFDRMKYETKRFENWKKEVLPFVQEDGRILTINERIEIWNKQQLEISNQK